MKLLKKRVAGEEEGVSMGEITGNKVGMRLSDFVF